MARNARRGFTLMELAVVIGMLSVLAALGVPAYGLMVRRARVAEARAVLETIAHAQMTYRRDHGRYLALPEHPAGAPTNRARPAANTPAEWKTVGVALTGDYWFQYSVRLKDDGFVVVARGDQDANGVQSQFELPSDTMVVSVKDELE